MVSYYSYAINKKKILVLQIEHVLLSYILTCCILGTIFLNLFGHNIIFLKTYSLFKNITLFGHNIIFFKREYVFIIDFLTHIIPLIYISFYYKKKKN